MISPKKFLSFWLLVLPFLSGGLFAAGGGAENPSVFRREFADVWLADAESAFNAYVGNWTGAEAVFADGREIMGADVVQSYVPSKNSRTPRLVCSGKIVVKGKSFPTSSYLYITDAGTLELDIITLEKDTISNVGKVERNSVFWTPKYLFYAFDVQRDSFYLSDRGVSMFCDAKKYVETPDGSFKGYIEVKMTLERDNAAFPKSKMSNSLFRQFGAGE